MLQQYNTQTRGMSQIHTLAEKLQATCFLEKFFESVSKLACVQMSTSFFSVWKELEDVCAKGTKDSKFNSQTH